MARFLLPLIAIALVAGSLAWFLGPASGPETAAVGRISSFSESADPGPAPETAADLPEPELPQDPEVMAELPDLEAGAARLPLAENRTAPPPDLETDAPPPGPTARLRILALRSDGKAWPLLKLQLGWHNGERRRQSGGLTDPFGNYETDLPADLDRLQLSWGDGHDAAFEGRDFRVVLRAWSTTVLVIEPRLPGLLLGQLVDASGTAVAGAKVCLDPKETGNALWRLTRDPDRVLAITGDNGGFELGGVTGDCWLRFLLPSGAEATAMVRLPEGAPVEQEFRLPRWRSLAVRVVDAKEQPLVGAELAAGVYFWSFEPGVTAFAVARARSDSDGWARFPQVDAAEIPLDARLAGYQNWSGIMPPDLSNREIAMVEAWTVEGQVFAWNGQPAAGAAVLLWVQEEEDDRIRQPAVGSWMARQADEAGRFRFRPRVSGPSGALLARAPGHARGVLWPLQLGPLTRGVDIVLDRESPLAGRVLQPDGEPVRDAEIGVQAVEPPWTWKTLFGRSMPWWNSQSLRWDRRQPLDADGGFSFAGLPAGLYDLEVRSRRDGRILAWARRGSFNRDIVIYLGEGTGQLVHFDFAVRAGRKGPPLTHFEIEITGSGAGGRTILTQRVLSTDGQYSWEGFLPGSYWIDVRAEGFRDYSLPRKRYRAGRHFIDAVLERPETK